ncbi:SH3 domain-containing protein [Pandoraea sp. XY-2]|uniref:SH3 domain-containing protein n=1 Tax=Pandoraea sp. XY-2 TaxID=2518599 RepID=UPI00101AF5EA|nr:SH3 domain-containing protein [Pandoraea sp. XY-2]QBC33010.1 peptide-binding protein [Pandoraea sp. XY-2]
MKTWTLPLVLAGAMMLVALPEAASAQSGQAVINAPANVRAGPAVDYPVVAQTGAGMPVTVYGCLSDYSWCDIGLPGTRGWIYAALLSYPYQGNPVPVLNYGPMIGLPIVTFSIGAYWGNYYRGRPWYHDQRYWQRPPPRPRPPGHYSPGAGPRPPGGHYPGAGPRPPGPGAGPGHRPPGHGAGPGPGPRPPGHNANPGPRPQGGGGSAGPRPPGGGNRADYDRGRGGGRAGGQGGGHGGRPPGGGPGGGGPGGSNH